MKNKLLCLVLAITLCAGMACFVACGDISDSENTNGDINVSIGGTTSENLDNSSNGGVATVERTLSVTEFSSPVSIVCKTLTDYMATTSDTIITSLMSYGETRRDQGRGVSFAYTIDGLTGDTAVENATVTVSENEDFSEGRILKFPEGKKSVKVYNLKTGEQYYFRIDVTLTDEETISKTGSFETVESPRMMRIDGIYNVRDIGGWKTADGKVIKQGLFYRGTELDGKKEANYKLTEEGISEMLNVLKIKTDMDLRDPAAVGGATEQSVLGENVPLYYYNARQYTGIFSDNGKANMRAIFADLAKPERYPVYLHCTYGCDRTGTVSLLLEGLLGVSQEDTIRDYELSSLFIEHINRENESFVDFIEELNKLDGDTFQAKIEGYLLSAGVTADEIESIKNIFL